MDMNSYCIKMVVSQEHLSRTFQCLVKDSHIKNSLSMNMFLNSISVIEDLMSLLISLCKQITHITGLLITVEKLQFPVSTSKM